MISPLQGTGLILMVALIVYGTRISGYLVGQKLRHIKGLRPVLETLPGCAMMAILVPAVREGSLVDFIALGLVLGLMWVTNNVIVATISGLVFLLFGHQLLAFAGL